MRAAAAVISRGTGFCAGLVVVFLGVCISCTAAFPDRSVRSMVVRDECNLFIFYYLAGSVKCPFLQRFEGTQSAQVQGTNSKVH